MFFIFTILFLLLEIQGTNCESIRKVQLECPVGWYAFGLTGYQNQDYNANKRIYSLCLFCYNNQNDTKLHFEICRNNFEIDQGYEANTAYKVTSCYELGNTASESCKKFHSSSYCQMKMTFDTDAELKNSIKSLDIELCNHNTNEPIPVSTDLQCPGNSVLSKLYIKDNRFHTPNGTYFIKSNCTACNELEVKYHFTVCSPAHSPQVNDTLSYTIQTCQELASGNGGEKQNGNNCGYKLEKNQSNFNLQNLIPCKKDTSSNSPSDEVN